MNRRGSTLLVGLITTFLLTGLFGGLYHINAEEQEKIDKAQINHIIALPKHQEEIISDEEIENIPDVVVKDTVMYVRPAYQPIKEESIPEIYKECNCVEEVVENKVCNEVISASNDEVGESDGTSSMSMGTDSSTTSGDETPTCGEPTGGSISSITPTQNPNPFRNVPNWFIADYQEYIVYIVDSIKSYAGDNQLVSPESLGDFANFLYGKFEKSEDNVANVEKAYSLHTSDDSEFREYLYYQLANEFNYSKQNIEESNDEATLFDNSNPPSLDLNIKQFTE